MTTLLEKKTRCGLCGGETKFTSIGSTNAFGSPDLDTRPPEMQRSTIFAWVQRCSICGYCAPDVSVASPGVQAVVSGKEYRTQLNDPTYPGLTNSFLCKAILDRESKDFAAATWALIHAAWACDDSIQTEPAERCRRRAADMLVLAEAHNQRVADQIGAGTAILVDLLRRSGQMDDARKTIVERRAGIEEDTIVRVLNFQKLLIDKDDTSCRTIAEALRGDG